MNPIISWIGGKRRITKILLDLIPKHKIYIEPFFGSGALLFAKEKSEIEVANDINTQLIQGYIRIQKNKNKIEKKVIGIENIIKLYEKKNKTPEDKIIKWLIEHSLGFRGRQITKTKQIKVRDRPYLINNKIKRLSEIQKRTKDVIFSNLDYKQLFELDSKDTFFFLDPPYENSKGLYKNETFNFRELSKILKNIKGKFILTLNDSENIREIFEWAKIIRINESTNSFTSKKMNEVIIMNY